GCRDRRPATGDAPRSGAGRTRGGRGAVRRARAGDRGALSAGETVRVGQLPRGIRPRAGRHRRLGVGAGHVSRGALMASTSAGAALVRAVPRGLRPRRIAEALFPDAAIHYVAGFDAMADLLDGFADQRPSTCGAYVARYVLGPLGFAVHDG